MSFKYQYFKITLSILLFSLTSQIATANFLENIFPKKQTSQQAQVRDLRPWLLDDGFAGTFYDRSSVPVRIDKVEVFVLDFSQIESHAFLCSQPPCFRLEVYLTGPLANGQYVKQHQVATWVASPGKPHSDGGGFSEESLPSRPHKPTWLSRDHKSKAYDNAPMPFSIFYNLDGEAIHGSYGRINGDFQSHGCIRINVEYAEDLFNWVQDAGKANTNIHIWETDPNN